MMVSKPEQVRSSALLRTLLRLVDPLDFFRLAQWVDAIAAAGGKSYTFHYEATRTFPSFSSFLRPGTRPSFDVSLCRFTEEPLALIKQIKATGMAAAMAISPATPAEVVTKEIADNLDMILVMTVVPGASHLLVFVQDVC